MCKKRKEKKLNMQGKDNMMLGYFIIYTHATHEKGRLGHNSSNSYSLHEIHEEIEDERRQITHVHILLTQGKEEGDTRDVLQRNTHICIDINTQKGRKQLLNLVQFLLLCELVVCFWIFTQFLCWTLCVANFFYNLEYYELVCNLVFYFPLFSHG